MKLPILILSALLTASLAAPSDPILTNPKLKSISTGTADNTNILKVDPTTGALTRVTIPAPDLSGYLLNATAASTYAPLASPNFSGTQNLDGIQNLTGTVTNLAADVVNIGTTGQLLTLNTEVHFDAGATFTYDAGIEAAHRAALGFGTFLATSGTSSGTNTGDQTITLTGDVTGSGTGSFATTIAPGTVTNAKLAGGIDLTTKVTGTLPVTNGGTGRATGTTAYALIATGTTPTGANQTLANGLTTEILVGGGAAALPVWTSASGTGAPVRAASPTISGTLNTGPIIDTQAAIGTTVTDGVLITNTAAAANGAQQYSPTLSFNGSGWGTGVNTSQSVKFREYVAPVQAATAPTGLLTWDSSIAGQAATTRMTLSTAGVLQVGGVDALTQTNTVASITNKSFGTTYFTTGYATGSFYAYSGATYLGVTSSIGGNLPKLLTTTAVDINICPNDTLAVKVGATNQVLSTYGGRIKKTTADTTTSLTLTSVHHFVTLSNAGAVTVNLPAGVTGTEYIIKNKGAGTVTIDPNASQELFTTTNVGTLDLTTGKAVIILWDGTHWSVVSDY